MTPPAAGPGGAITRAIVIVLDSVGIGALPDAARYGDEGSDTLGNTARAVPLSLPHLASLGLGALVDAPGIPRVASPGGCFAKLAEASAGKDSVTGHWELMGIVLDEPFPLYPDGFPAGIMDEFERRIGRGTLGNKAASGTVIIDELGEEHLRTGRPIVYTSADSVFQIAAHEDVIPLPELYRMCEIAFDIVSVRHGVGRVIARPFVGVPGHFRRTSNRHDFARTPIGDTLLDRLSAAAVPVVAIGKIRDLFAGRGIRRATPTTSDAHGIAVLLDEMAQTPSGLIFVNLVDFDVQYGHRNDPAGYAANLERFDRALPAVLAALRPTDLLAITADHGNDPTTPSTDHSREYVPLLLVGAAVAAGRDLGVRSTFADLGQTLADLFGVTPLAHGTSFLQELRA